jgi:exopolysaccharide production protein ExoY
MTGLWQVSGRNALDYDDLRHLDYVYAASWSFGWDLRIILQTPASVLLRRGVV